MPLFQKKRKIPIAIISAFVIVFIAGAIAALADNEPVSDNHLKDGLISLGADSNGDGLISAAEIAALSGSVDLSGRDISDIGGLEALTGAVSLDLHNNSIRDIQPLVNLIETTPHSLTTVDISGNYLTGDDEPAIAAIEASGCTVINTSQKASQENSGDNDSGISEDPAVSEGSSDILSSSAFTDDFAQSSNNAEFGADLAVNSALPVKPVSGISLSVKAKSMAIGDSFDLSADITPADATDTGIVWASSDTNVATVSNGAVKGISSGTATITAASKENAQVLDSCIVTVKSPVMESVVYPIDRTNGIIKGVLSLTMIEQFISNIRSDAADLAVYDSAGNISVQTAVKTGMTVKLSVDGTERDSLKVAVCGDGNGDGLVTVADYTLARLNILGLKGLDELAKAACDVNGDGSVSVSDYTSMRLSILGLKALSSPLPELPEVTDPRIRAFLDVALMQRGKPYVWSAEGPDSFDCSGFIYYCLNKAGYSVSRTTANNYSKNESWAYIPRDQLQPGDLMFYVSDSNPDTIGHVGIYLGNGYHIHASSTYGCVVICRIEGWYDKMLSHGRRVFN